MLALVASVTDLIRSFQYCNEYRNEWFRVAVQHYAADNLNAIVLMPTLCVMQCDDDPDKA